MRRALLLAGLLLMPDVLGLPDEPVVMAPNYLGVPEPVAFKAKAALPAGGPITGGTAPSTVSGGGVAPAPVGMSAGGGGGPSSPQQRASEALRALGLSADALKFVDQSRALFGGGKAATGVPTPTSFPQMQSGQGAELENAMDDATFAALVREAVAEQGAGAGAGAGISGTEGPGPGAGIGAAGTALNIAGAATGDPDVKRAGAAATAAGTATETGSSIAAGAAPYGLLAAMAIEDMIRVAQQGPEAANTPVIGDTLRSMTRLSEGDPKGLLAFPGFATTEDLFTKGPSALPLIGGLFASDDAKAAEQAKSARNVLGSKVPAAVSRLNKSLTDTQGVDFSTASTEDLRAQMQTLQGARQEFNAIDQAFKPGVMTVGGKPIHTGLTLDTVRPQMDALNLTQLRLQDELARRGVTDIPGAQSPVAWVNAFAPDFFHQGGRRYGEDLALSLQGADADPAAYANYARDPGYYGIAADDPTLGFYRQLTGLAPGGYEQGLGTFLHGQGIQSPLRVASREPDPSAPVSEPSTGALEQLAAFGLLPGGGAARGEEVLETT